MKKTLYIPLLFIFFISCIQEFDLKLNKLEKLLVVDGLITNGVGPYYVRLTRSSNSLNSVIIPKGDDIKSWYIDNAEPVTNAVVIISDNLGNNDTLIPVPQYYATWIYFNDSNGHKDSVYRPKLENRYCINKGFYRTTHIQGVTGQYYNLSVLVDGKEYHSQCFMPPLPKIDSLSYIKKISEVKKDIYYSPLIYFNKPTETGYYLFRFYANIDLNPEANTVLPVINSTFAWDYTIISSKLLTPYINGLDIQKGTWVKRPLAGSYNYGGSEIRLTMNSLTEEGYEFYNNLIGQYKNDGGAFKPTPASPVGNISNGALGFFRASATIELRKKIVP